MLSSLAPARRRLAIAVIVLVLAGAVVLVVVALGAGEEPVRPVSQDEQGPVLLVPGYGGSTAGLEVLAEALEEAGRDTEIVPSPGDGTGDLREHAAVVAEAADAAIADGAPSVDVVGYSAGGVVVRYWVAELGGGSQARRVVSLASPQHGTDVAALAGDVAAGSCPEACRQLAPDSDLLRALDAGDETPDGPVWVAIWTEDDRTVVPPTSGVLDGALSFSVQSVCPDLVVAHADVPSTPAVTAMTEQVLGTGEVATPGPEVCAAR